MTPAGATRPFADALGSSLDDANLDGTGAPPVEERFEIRNEIIQEAGRGAVMLWHRTHDSGYEAVLEPGGS